MYMIQQSFINEIKKNNDLSLYIYSDSRIKTDQTFNCKSKTNLPNGTETTFVVQYEFGGIFIDFLREDEDYLLNRYIKHENSDGVVSNIRITSYNNTTGEITIEKPFEEALTTEDTFSIIVLDSLYCYANSPQTIGGQKQFSLEHVRIDMKLQTKDDSSRRKILGFIDAIRATVNESSSLPIYETEEFSIVQGYAKPTRNFRFNETLNSGEQYLEYFGNINLEYYNGY